MPPNRVRAKRCNLSMKIVTAETIAELLARAVMTPRKRMNLNLHAELSDPTNRFLNAGLAGTYVRPHRHRIGKWELLNVLQGRLDVVIFGSRGEVNSRFSLGPKEQSLIEIQGGEWHSFVFYAPSAVVLEVKPGPYESQFDKEFAEWAPMEGDPTAILFLSWLESAAPGEIWPGHCNK
jgi:cupin fold WbuC family metalloprotein